MPPRSTTSSAASPRRRADGRREEIRNPASGDVIASAPLSNPADIDAAVQAAARAFDGWSQTPPGERALALLRIADAIEEHATQLIELESLNVGKPIAAMRDEIPFIVDNLRFFAGAARCSTGQAAGEYMAGYTSMLRREPLGVIGQIAPWNYPLMMAIWKIGPALAAGNTVVLKPSEQTPMTASLLAGLAAEHLPAGVLNVVYGHGEDAGAALVTHPQVAMVSLTGDVATGREVARAASASLKRVHLELGGKAPVVVFDDADVEAVVAGVRLAGFFNAGQDCTAASRVLAGARVHDDLVAALGAAAASLVVGDPADEETELGPVISPAHLDRVTGFLSARRSTRSSSRDRPPRWTARAPTSRRRSSRASTRTTSSCSARSSGRSSRCSASTPTRRRSPAPTASTTAWRRACGRATSRAR